MIKFTGLVIESLRNLGSTLVAV